jgi:hypothetical protein
MNILLNEVSRLDLETQILNLLSENPDKDYTMVEIYEAINRIKLTKVNLVDLHHKIIPTVGVALTSLLKYGKIDVKLVGSPRYVLLYQIKK